MTVSPWHGGKKKLAKRFEIEDIDTLMNGLRPLKLGRTKSRRDGFVESLHLFRNPKILMCKISVPSCIKCFDDLSINAGISHTLRLSLSRNSVNPQA